jgi:hypothetical protein
MHPGEVESDKRNKKSRVGEMAAVSRKILREVNGVLGTYAAAHSPGYRKQARLHASDSREFVGCRHVQDQVWAITDLGPQLLSLSKARRDQQADPQCGRFQRYLVQVPGLNVIDKPRTEMCSGIRWDFTRCTYSRPFSSGSRNAWKCTGATVAVPFFPSTEHAGLRP